ncbi:hypothetical protein baBA2_000789 [Borrelia anserina]|uniref:Uncharacterized protein n=2 Tax=Borrelia anserina TaxID=143 RepID=W5SNI7_BORAN|nr:hypothetical protein [Borrelia anserina]AHH08759.1 Hypothetical protein BAN_0036500 [Borrelia anserina BA2]APR65209.1 hypothetical protein N187_03930 [Borrelia anserina Es]UPA07133.1 hypothetical protein baBA2_000789 [Borrelia anserina]
MGVLKIIFLVLSLANLNAGLKDINNHISEILFIEAKNFAGTQRELDMLYGSLEFNLKNSDSLYRLSLRNDISLLDRIYLLRSAIEIDNFKFVKPRDLYYQYFSLILSQNEDISENRNIIELYDKLDGDLQNDKDLVYMRLEASNRLKDFKGSFDKVLENSFAMYGDDLRFFKWFLREDKFFPSLFSKLKLKEDSFFKSDNIDFIFKNTTLNESNSIALFTFLKNKSKKLNGVQSTYLLKYKLLTPDEAYMFFKDEPPEIIGEYKMFYELLRDPIIQDEFLSHYKNLSGTYFVNDKNSVVVFEDGSLVSFFSQIVNYSTDLSLEEKYFNKVYFKDKIPIRYENTLLGYKVSYSVYPYVSMIEVDYPDKRCVYTFALDSFRYEIFDDFGYSFDYVGINEFLMADVPEIFRPIMLSLNPKRVSDLKIQKSLIEKRVFNNFDVIEIKNYSFGDLISVYKKINGAKRFNYVEIYDKGVLKVRRVILDDSFDVYHNFN